MIGLLQRVNWGQVEIEGRLHARIEHGLVVLVGIQKGDDQAKARQLVDRLLAYRVFPDADNKMNLSLRDIGGGLLLVSQFTLAADTRRGLRPSFSSSLPPAQAEPLWEYLLGYAKAQHNPVRGGEFAAHMQVALENDGPVTFWLQV